MNIIYRIGSFLDGPESVVVHGCNAQGAMGRGAALAVREKYPWAYDVYRQAYIDRIDYDLPLGTIVWTIDIPSKKIVGNAITQRFWRNEPGEVMINYFAIREVMWAINDYVVAARAQWTIPGFYWGSVAMPKIGSGLGGGDWTRIAKIIEDNSPDYQPVIYTL